MLLSDNHLNVYNRGITVLDKKVLNEFTEKTPNQRTMMKLNIYGVVFFEP